MDHSTTKSIEYTLQANYNPAKDEMLRRYNESSLAASKLEAELSCLASASTNGDGSIFIWTHASFIERVAFYPFSYTFVETHMVKMVYANANSQYVMPNYYV